MKILALSKEIPPVDWTAQEKLLAEEANVVHQMYLDEHIREFYFTPDGEAVLILECSDAHEAREILSQLPLVRQGLITFDFLELRPYTGFTRLF